MTNFAQRTLSRATGGFTLVELLVAIGVLVLIISILLPAVGAMKQAAGQVHCMANLRQLGSATLLYANSNEGAILPGTVWGPSGKDDSWAHLLVASGIVPNPQIKATSDVAAGGFFVCPKVVSSLKGTNIAGLAVIAEAADGYERRQSTHVQPGLIVDYGYGINATVNLIGPGLPANNSIFCVPSTAISMAPADTPRVPHVKRIAEIKQPAKMVLFFDGVAWNLYVDPERLSGARHGRFNSSKPVDTGTTNLLFLDGHVENAKRMDLPSEMMHVVGDSTQMRTPNFNFNINQR